MSVLHVQWRSFDNQNNKYWKEEGRGSKGGRGKRRKQWKGEKPWLLIWSEAEGGGGMKEDLGGQGKGEGRMSNVVEEEKRVTKR